jgi:uncharacterized integral membrane protein
MKKILEKYNLTPKQLLYIVLLVLLLVFVGQNVDYVRVKFLFFGFELPLIVIIGGSFLIGFFAAVTFRRKSKADPNEKLESAKKEDETGVKE